MKRASFRFLLCFLFLTSHLYSGISHKTEIYTGLGSTSKSSDLVVGNSVLSFAIECGLIVSKDIKITKITKKSSSKVVFIKTKNGLLCVTTDEMFYNPVRDVWISASNLKTTDFLLDSNIIAAPIKKVAVVTLKDSVDTYDFVTDQPHMFFLSDSKGGSFLVHNNGFWEDWGVYVAGVGAAVATWIAATATTTTAVVIPAAAATAAGLGIAVGGTSSGVATTAGITAAVTFISAPVLVPLAAVGGLGVVGYVGYKTLADFFKEAPKEDIKKYLDNLARSPKIVKDEAKHVAKQVIKVPKIVKDEVVHIVKQAHRTAKKLRNFTRKFVKHNVRTHEAVPPIEGLDDILEGAIPSAGNKPKSGTKEYIKPGGDKEKDKEKLNPKDQYEPNEGINISTVPNGTVIDRVTSSGDMSTLEVQRKRKDGKVIETTKIRYV